MRTFRFIFTALYDDLVELEESKLAINVHAEDSLTRIFCLYDSFVIPVKDVNANIDLVYTNGEMYHKYFTVSVDNEKCRIIVHKGTNLQTKISSYETDD